MKKRGVALIWTLILSTVLIIISTTMVNYIVKESQFTVRIEESTQVYAAAKSGADWAKWYRAQDDVDLTHPYNFDLIGDDSENDTTVLFTGEDSTTIESITTYRGVTRKLKYLAQESPMVAINPLPTVNNTKIEGTNTESFTMQFDFWLASSDLSKVTPSFGVQDSSGKNQIFFDYTMAGDIRLNIYQGGVLKTTDSITNIMSDANKTSVYHYRAQIRYIKDTAAKLTLFSREPITGEYACIGSKAMDLSMLQLDNMSYLYARSNLSLGSGIVMTESIPEAYTPVITFKNSSGSKIYVVITNPRIKR